MDARGVAERRHARRIRPRGLCGYRPRRRPATSQAADQSAWSNLPPILRRRPGIVTVLRAIEGLSDDHLARLLANTEERVEEMRRAPDFDRQEAIEIGNLHEKGAGMIGGSPEITAAEHERFETSRYRDYAYTFGLWFAAHLERERRHEERDPLYVSITRYTRVSKRLARRSRHMHPSQVRREIARELYGHHGRAPRPATNTRTRGSRRRSHPRVTRGPPSDDDPHEQPDHVNAAPAAFARGGGR
jgi:hypothetical protein